MHRAAYLAGEKFKAEGITFAFPPSLPALSNHFDIIAVNDAYLGLPTVHHLVSYHDEMIWPWLFVKGPRELYHDEWRITSRTITHSQRANKGVKHVWTFEDGGGSSSLFAVQVALALEYERIILCGVPFDDHGRYYEAPGTTGHDYVNLEGWDVWERMHQSGKLGNVRAMSGKTEKLLGKPERNWIWPHSTQV